MSRDHSTTLDTKLPLARASGDNATDKAFREQMRPITDHFRVLKTLILLPDPKGVNEVLVSLIQAIQAEATDDWRLMPR